MAKNKVQSLGHHGPCDVIRKHYWKFKTGSDEGWQDGTKAIN